ncbi:lytic transglycosylase domain-containing protein [Dysgonomonas sp. 520]|uniref:lytic transglycosylase domain-containing protein n=1 Tax=Dysgonomonas sp. 520 TaxID=2302931 RepID=UPI0013D7F957|nr:lytic transglycosylase domain-containing protein [Dysgonomonas sp. 520]NDW09132.1 lytic transglycosylase domain-containing protein [Dysgonomonas sp. 520]
MKKSFILIAASLCICLSGIILISNHNAEDVANDEKNSPLVASMTASVEVPSEVTFAGEKLKLDRYDLYERYDREINSFTYLHSSTLLIIKKANRYFPIIEPILKANGIPDDFKYLAVIESMLNPRAISTAKAAGLWQFMPSTATQYGLEVSSQVDERYSVEKSTVAACKYLKNAYNRYGNWASVAMSYNAGMGRISSELEQQQVEDSTDLWLVEETSRYYFRMLAVKSIFENPKRYGYIIKAEQLYKPIDFKEVRVRESVSDLATFAQNNGITYAQLKDFNSWLRDRSLTINPKKPKEYTILIPTQESLYYDGKVKVHDKNWVRN